MKNMMKLKNENLEKGLKRHEADCLIDAVNPECLNSKSKKKDAEEARKKFNSTI